SHNSLFTKEFYVSTAPEVGRIIDVQNLPSTVYLDSLSNNRKSTNRFYEERQNPSAEQYIAQTQPVKHHMRSASLL
ncbi:hypothetical protein, partial [Pseudomonas sp. AP19]|uniref:hypothetical protein n=1 Tax=Pseudomonas sp. AP19 TaxID=1535623 RepID=UPI001C47319E